MAGSFHLVLPSFKEERRARLGESAASEVLVITKTTEGGTADCPDNRECHLVCKGNRACQNLKGTTGFFSKITCDSGSGSYACAGATLPSCPTEKRCELHCKGQYACGYGAKVVGYDSLICDGQYACFGGWNEAQGRQYNTRLLNCPANKLCSVICKGPQACNHIQPMIVGSAGSSIDILNGGGGSLPASALPKAEALPRTMVAARIVGVSWYSWPPEACKGVRFTYLSVCSSYILL